MRDFQLRTDLERAVIGGFALPLGFAPAPGAPIKPPVQGYTVAFNPAEEDEPDTYSFYVLVSHERLRELVRQAFRLLPEKVYAIVEIGSRDAYRSMDVYLGREDEPMSRRDFLRVWNTYEPFLLEDGSIAAGAKSDSPFIEVFLDQWKGVLIHVPPARREAVEAMLRAQGLEEVEEIWPEPPDDGEAGPDGAVRPVLDLSDASAPGVDELLLELRHDWNLDLNIDRDSNADEAGRELGSTLWHAVVIVDGADPRSEQSAYASIWATASSLGEMEELIQSAMADHPEWTLGEIFTIDRVAFDERPDELANLSPARRESKVHLVTIDPWSDPTAEARPDESDRDDNQEGERK